MKILVIENVGNLVWPAELDVGAHAGVIVFPITEGEEKPLRYPVMFRSELVLINTMDLLSHLDFDLEAFRTNLRAVEPRLRDDPGQRPHGRRRIDMS